MLRGSVNMQRILAETRALLAIGGPLVVNNLCTIGLQTIDTVMAGQLGARDLAAVANRGSFLGAIVPVRNGGVDGG